MSTERHRNSDEVLVASTLPEDVQVVLRRAKRDVEQRVRFEEDTTHVVEAAQALARGASQRAGIETRDQSILSDLSDANALVVAAMSLPDLSGFPRRVSAQSLLWLANLCGSIGRELELQQRAEEALERYMLGLRLLVMLRARRPWYALDKVGYWLMARSAPIVGELAARRQMSFEDMMEVFNENLEPYAGLLRDGSTRTPVAFALLAHARSLLNIVAGTQEVGSLRDDLIRVAPMAEPAEGAARQRFNGELRALMSEIDLLQHHRRGTEMFEWGKAAPENPAKSS